ncbi:MAG: cell division protein ZapA [Sphingomonadales bacterium]|jgi:cell division protein ZapA
MAMVAISLAGRHYKLACRDGDEARLQALAAGLDADAKRLTAQLGSLGEGQLLVMLALMRADALAERDAAAAPTPADLAPLAALVARAEALADRLEQHGPPATP